MIQYSKFLFYVLLIDSAKIKQLYIQHEVLMCVFHIFPLVLLQVNTTSEDGCNLYTCGVNGKGDLVLQTKVTTCPPFNRQACLDEGVRLPQ